MNSGNESIDNFIKETKVQNNKLKWISFNEFKNIEYLDRGGFGIIYKATLFNKTVALKSLNDLNNLNENSKNSDEFLNEWKYHNQCIQSMDIIKLYGFTQNTSNYIAVMDYAEKGSLRRCLTEIVKIPWSSKLFMLSKIIDGINQIHQQDLIHCDLHDGNILIYDTVMNMNRPCINDLGLCQPVGSSSGIDTCGVIPFIAPEVFRRRKPYTFASDIYSFSMIMWEFTSGVPQFNDRAHDFQLCLSICKGERPEIIENTPQCYIDLMKKCWDEDPSKRPSALEILNIIEKWIKPGKVENISKELKNNIMEFIKADYSSNSTTLKTISNNPISKSHPQAFYTSRLLDFTKDLNDILGQELKEIYGKSINVDSYEVGISQSIAIEDLNITEDDINEAEIY